MKDLGIIMERVEEGYQDRPGLSIDWLPMYHQIILLEALFANPVYGYTASSSNRISTVYVKVIFWWY